VADWDFGKQRGLIESMSATKSIVNLAIGRLVETGKIKSIDQPVSDFFPEWKQGRKKLITIRHLLNHTSGLQNERNTTLEIYPSPDFVQLALAAELSDEPGSKFAYNNKAVNLLAGLVLRTSGTRMDLYIGKEIFEPLGIKKFTWSLDRSGNPHGMSGLQIRAMDMARIGQLMLDEGSWKGKQILSKEWIKVSVEPGQKLDPTCGLLWWLLRDSSRYLVDDEMVNYFKKHGMTAETVKKLEAFKGKSFDSAPFLDMIRPIVRGDEVLKTNLAELNRDFGSLKPVVGGAVRGYYADGYLGQYLVVIPEDRLVAVRQRRGPDGSEDPKKGFTDFPRMVGSLVIKANP
jgi:CubicO group peptidase (beta-lactamase class C family)